jgi:inorganic pyrophosphatase
METSSNSTKTKEPTLGKKERQMTVNVIIEILKGTQNKYEFDKGRGLIKFEGRHNPG